MNGKKVGIIIGAVAAGALVIIAGVIVAIFLLGKKTDVYRVIKVMSAEGHCYVTRGEIKDLEAYDGMALQSGDSIHVDGNSSLVLMLFKLRLNLRSRYTELHDGSHGNKLQNGSYGC